MKMVRKEDAIACSVSPKQNTKRKCKWCGDENLGGRFFICSTVESYVCGGCIAQEVLSG
jgi:hypothetical protein